MAAPRSPTTSRGQSGTTGNQWWDAKAAAALSAEHERASLDRVDALDEAERSQVQAAIGPMPFDLAALVEIRSREHSRPTSDIDVVDPNAGVAVDAASLVVDHLDLIVGSSAHRPGSNMRYGSARPIQFVT